MGAQWKVINANYKNLEGYKRVAWPPASEERIVREFTPQPQTQFPPAPAYNQQQQQQQPAATAVPPTQGPIYNNVQHHTQYNISNTNNFARETNSPYPNETEYEAFPPQTPETPIILKDKQFSRLPSHEPNQINSVPYQQQPQNQYQQHHHQQQQHYPQQQQQQQKQQEQQPQYQQPLYNQQQYPPNQQNVSYDQHQHQQQQQQQQYQHFEEQHQQTLSGWKPIRPPQSKPDHFFTGAYGAKETTPSVAAAPIYQQQYQNYQQPSIKQQQQYRAPSYDNYQQPQQYQQPPQQQQKQFTPQPQYQAQTQAPSANQYQQQPPVGTPYQQPPQQQYQQPAWAQPQQQYQQPPWVQQPQQQQFQQQQQQQQPQYQNPLNQYNQAPHQQQQQLNQYPPQQNQFVPQTNQPQFNSYSQPQQQQQHTVSHDQVDQHYQPHLSQDQRGVSPGIITLRKEAPITQQPAPVYTSQPAAVSYRESSTDGSLGGSNMRGDLKWPPPEYKEAADKENEERRKLALGPVCRPRKINRDYTTFFAKNALSHHYPSYKVPPGTQHMIN